MSAINYRLALNVQHPDCHKAADAFWAYWKENGETHRHGYYESTWGAINRAIRMVGVMPHDYGAAPAAPAGMAVPEGYTLVAVKGLDELVRALNRAESKGYMPDAMADEWAAFDYREVAASPSAQAAPARGAMTEEQIEAEFDAHDRTHGFVSSMWSFEAGVRFAEKFHGIGTTAPAGGEQCVGDPANPAGCYRVRCQLGKVCPAMSTTDKEKQ